MEAIAQELVVLAGVYVVAFVGPTMAMWLLVVRKRRARSNRRSPISLTLLRSAGGSLREQLDDLRLDIAIDLIILTGLPLMTLAMFLAQGHFRGLEAISHLAPIYFAVPSVIIAFVLRRLWKRGVRADNLKAGFDAELAVGQELDWLMRQGAQVFHDMPADKFNIDHVVISAEGVFAVETKGFTKPNRKLGRADATVEFDGRTLKFPLRKTDAPLAQAERQAEWLSKWLSSAVGSAVPVIPVLALPGWFVKRTGSGSVRVYSGKELAGLLSCRRGPRTSQKELTQIAHQVEQRCRTVAPRYADETRAT